jgi:plasmid stabilization system protein ParE
VYKVQLLPSAKLDIKESAEWYNIQQKGLGKRFTSTVRSNVRFIQKNPRAFSIRYDETHTALLDVFPFMIHYVIDEEKQLITIANVLHTSRDPKNWKKR